MRWMLNRIIIVLFYIFRIFPIHNNKIVISSYLGSGYGDNGKYIVNELLKQKKDYDIVWLSKNKNSKFPEGIRAVEYRSLRSIYEQCTAHIWIDNRRKPFYVRKRRGQYYIQTWHGGIALKRVEKDAENVLPDTYIKSAKNDSKMADIMLSNSRYCTEMYRRAFWYDGEIMLTGSPRNDILLNTDLGNMDLVKEKIGVPFGKKAALYAPTFRADGSMEHYNIDCNKLCYSLKNEFGGDWVVLFRLHPNISYNNIDIDSDKVINVSGYDDMYELMSITDVFITDYSSTMFEAALRKIPIFLFASDISEYIDDRGFYFDLNELPFSIAADNDELERLIQSFTEKEYLEKLASFMTKLGVYEPGNASESVCKHIDKILNLRKQ